MLFCVLRHAQETEAFARGSTDISIVPRRDDVLGYAQGGDSQAADAQAADAQAARWQAADAQAAECMPRTRRPLSACKRVGSWPQEEARRVLDDSEIRSVEAFAHATHNHAARLV